MDLLHTVANRLTSTVTSVAGSPMQRRVNVALNSDSTTPSHADLVDIANQSVNWSDYSDITQIIQSNLKLPLKLNGRLLYATVMLVEAMLVYGNTDILVDCRSWVPKLSELEHARLSDEFGHDAASALRMSACRCLSLIREPERLKEERSKHQIKNTFTHSGGQSNYSGYSKPSYQSSNPNNHYSSNNQYSSNNEYSSNYQHSSSNQFSTDNAFSSNNQSNNPSYQSSYSAPTSRFPSPSMNGQSSGYVPPRINHSDSQFTSNSAYNSPAHSPNPYRSNGYGSSINQSISQSINSRPRAASASHHQYSNTLGVDNKPTSYYTPPPQSMNQQNRPSINQSINQSNARSSNSSELSWMIEDRSINGVPTLSPPPNHRSINQSTESKLLFDLDFLTAPSDAKQVSQQDQTFDQSINQSINQSNKQDEPPAFVPDYMKSVHPVDLESLIR